jgi:hypothetical protein
MERRVSFGKRRKIVDLESRILDPSTKPDITDTMRGSKKPHRDGVRGGEEGEKEEGRE